MEEKEDELREDNGGKRMFVVEPFSLQYARAPGNYHKDPRIKRASHSNVVEGAIHFFRTGLPGSDMLCRV